MGAKVLILAKSLIPNFLRACAIVHCRSDLLVGVKSLLADLVKRNIEHECSLNGCSQRVPVQDQDS